MAGLRAISLWFFDKRFDMTMKMNKLALAIGALVMAGGAMAQTTATTTGTATVNVIEPITLTAVNSLEFGNIVKGSGTVTIAAADGARTDSDPSLTPGAQKGLVRAGTFAVTGEKGFTYAITIPVGSLTITGPASVSMSVSNFTVVSGAGDVAGLVGTIDATTGLGSLKVGARLNPLNQAAGTYTGSYAVTVAYN